MIVIKAKEIELLKNLAQFEFDKLYFDFHNDFYCTKISYINNYIELLLKHMDNNHVVTLRFLSAEIVQLNFEFNIKNEVLTVDTLYRGRFEVDGKLFEFNANQKPFYYLEFYEGQTIEFFCETIEITYDTNITAIHKK